ncbi:Protease Do-like 9 [Durusdinium trenchii]|uniref:Protease Do-like 9 n=1 Tax=Durusdinium trenchii TaxID=1381693 RepID=A0ABP0SRB5_9DINO
MARAGDFEKEARPRHTWNKEGPPSFGTMLKWDVGGEEDLTDAVVQLVDAAGRGRWEKRKVFAAVSEPNYAVPWVYKPQDARDPARPGQWLLTNAHVIRHAAVIQVRKRGDHQKFLAKLLCVGLDCDLAILTLGTDPLRPVPWSFVVPRTAGARGSAAGRREDALPRLQEEVTVVGYPIGGDNACVTVGVVSRIDMQRYNVCWTQSLLAIQIDAAINPGNSGGPCFGAGDFSGCLLGVAFQVLGREDAENIGYIIPAEALTRHRAVWDGGKEKNAFAGKDDHQVVHHFLTDYIQNQRYTGFGSCGFAVQPLENARMRLALGLKPHQSGVRVTMVHPASAAHEAHVFTWIGWLSEELGYMVVSVGDLIIKVQGQEIGALERSAGLGVDMSFFNRRELQVQLSAVRPLVLHDPPDPPQCLRGMPIPLLSVGPAVPTFDMAAEDDGDDGYDFDLFVDDATSHHSVWPEPEPPARTTTETFHVEPNEVEQPPTSPTSWRCLRCDSTRATYVGQFGRWHCSDCGSHEFYQVDKPTKSVTSTGTWMYVPNAPAAASPSSKGARRRRRKKDARDGGFPGDDHGQDDDENEQAESEQLTNDPVIDPDGKRGPDQDHHYLLTVNDQLVVHLTTIHLRIDEGIRAEIQEGSGKSMSSGKSMPRRQTYITEVIDEEAMEADEFEDAHEQPDELEVEAEQEEQPEDEEGQEATDDVTDDLTNLAQVLTVTARKLSGITLGRKFSTGNKSKKSPDELRKVTHCSACGALGHWYQDQACPMNQGAGAGKAGKSGKGSKGSSSSSYRQTSGPDKKADRPHQVSVVHHEHGSLEVNDAPTSDYGTMFAINMVTNLPFQVHETKGFGTGGHDLTGYMVLDSACQRTCAGKAWYRSHVDMLFKHHLKTKEIPSEDVFQFGKGEPTAFLMRTAPPAWLQRWRRLVSCLEAFKRNIWIYMAGGVRLGIMPKSWLDHAVPPEMSPRLHPEKCQHTVIKRYGNAHGRFARCQTCLRKWKWNNKKEDWDIWSSQGGGYLASSSRQLPLPQPSSKATASAGSTSKARPKPKAKSTAVPCSAWTSTLSGWTSFEMGYTLHTDHLTQEEQVEVFRILEQRSPLEAEPTTVAEFAFLNEEHFRPHREKQELAADRKRHERLVELGVLIEEDEEIMDWGLIDEIAKRLRGDWNKAADILEKEYQVYATSKPTMERPPPYADLWELFAGSSNMTRLAAHYNLNTLQPMDLLYGQNFKDPAMRKMIFQKLDHYKPWLVIMGVDCRLWNQFNINLNWSSPDRRLALRHLQDDEKVLVEFAVAVALRQHRAGRYFLLENPQRSQLWNLEEVTDLLGLRGVWTTDLDCGAYGAEVDGQPIAKPMRWAGNQPGLHEQLNRRLTPLQKMYCTPIQGKLTRRSQEYPDELCHAVLQELRALIFQKEPLRFGPPQHKVYATAYPTADLDLWDDIVKYVDNVYERGAKRPFNFPVDSDMGKRIQELFRIKAVRIQAFYAPTSRRIPANVDEYFTRAAFLQYAGKTRAVEVEDLDQIEFPRQRFSKAVAFGIFAYGFRMETTSPATPAPDADRAIIPGLTTDISFSGLHMAGLMKNRDSETTFELLTDLWLRPYGLPLKFSCDPDRTFRGEFEKRLMSLGVIVEHCPPEAHYLIGMIERRNAILRLTIERLIDQFAIVDLADVPLILVQACHACNTMAFTRGRSAYQAVSGRVPRLPNDVLTDGQVLSTSTQPFRDPEHPGLRAELVRSEALKTLIDLNAQQQFRRALLRKTRNTSIPDLQPGQRCAVWRWTKKGVRKRGAWLAARFLSWDPAHEGKQAWVRLGASTTLVTAEQLRAAHSFEDWCPDEQDIKVLKDASKNFGQHMLEDERGPPPPEEALTQDAHLEQEALEYDNTAPPMTPAMAVPATPAQASQAAPSTPAPQGSTTTNVQVNIDSPTHMHHHTTVQTLQRFGDLPKQLRTTRSRGPTTPLESAHSKRTRATPAELAASSTEHLANTATGETAPAIAPHSEFHQAEVDTPQAPTILEEPQHPPEGPQVTFAPTPAELVPVPDDEDLEDGTFSLASRFWNGTPPQHYGPQSKTFFKCYTTTAQRQQDIANTDKPAEESDTSVDSEDSSTQADNKQPQRQHHAAGLTRQERKQLDREIPWRHILTMPAAYVDKFLAAIEKESNSWSEWQSVRPLTKEECRQVLQDKILRKRIMRSRACYRDKNVGQGEVKAKCRIVCLGHEDPDLDRLSRSSPTPGRTIEMICYQMIVSGLNGELFNTTLKWSAWAGDAQTAFLQGRQKDSERPLPLYMKAPKDGLISKTSCWSHELYQILGNVYGSQIGLLAGFTTPSVKMQPTKYTVIDWRSCRAPRVCRSTLAAEACAADEASDRASYLNRMASELHFNEPAHRVGARMAMAQAIDAKSLYDALLADAPNISDRRSLVSVRSNSAILARLEASVAKKKSTSEKIVHAFANLLTTLPYRYFIIGGLVFVPLSEPFLWDDFGALAFRPGANYHKDAPISMLWHWFDGVRESMDHEVIVLSQVLASPLTVGFTEPSAAAFRVLPGVRPTPSPSTSSVSQLCQEEYLTFEIERNNVIILPRKEATQQTTQILKDGTGTRMFVSCVDPWPRGMVFFSI